MDAQSVVAARYSLNQAALARFAARRQERETKQSDIAEKGVLGAAGTTGAVRRAMQMTVAEGRVATVPQGAAPGRLEAIVGFNDFDQVNFLEHGLRAARSVCRLVYQNQPIGTGFLVAPGLLLTNHHVIPSAEAAQGFVAQFDYQLDADENPLKPARFALDPSRAFATSGVDDFDFTLVAVRAAGLAGDALAAYGWLPLNPSTDKILEGEPVVVIQHPEGREKQICLFHSEMVDRFAQYIHYTTDTDLGSSGSPAFNRQWQVVGLHHASAPNGDTNRGAAVSANEGVRISAILTALQTGDKVTGAANLFATLTDPATQESGRPQAPMMVVSTGKAPGLEATAIRTHPPGWYDAPAQPGYDANFLGTHVPLPALPAALANDATALADGSYELKYMHYSVVMCASRKLPYFSAANIDGASTQPLARADRDPDHPQPVKPGRELEAADAWFYDSRIPSDAQIGPQVYDRTEFDYGHQTRRLDPVWGDDRTMRVANDDTFHMTNCAPQHHKLNTVTWAHLENAVLKAAGANKLKFTVITGPVLDPRDPAILGVQCPTAFWKVIAYIENGALVAMGFLQWQTDLVGEIRAKLESLAELAPAEQWHVPIADITRLTALDFGPLLQADVKAGRGSERLTESLVNRLVPG
jgi:endonuclease G